MPVDRRGAEFMALAYECISQDFTFFHNRPAVGVTSTLFTSF